MKYAIICESQWEGTDIQEEIEGDFSSEQEALEAFGGCGVAMGWAVMEQGVHYYLEEIEEIEEDE